MKYAVIKTAKGKEQGFSTLTHKTLNNGREMIVNENELLTKGEDIEAVAASMQGYIVTRGELENIVKTDKTKNQ